MPVGEWLEAYKQAWEAGDADACAALFAEDAIYRSAPFRDPLRGRSAIFDYWTRATGGQDAVAVRLGEPVIEGRRAAVEWWTTMTDVSDGPLTLPGVLVLRFDAAGRCEELREYWAYHHGVHEAPEGWGSLDGDAGGLDREGARAFGERYAAAWRKGDAGSVVRLFTDDAIYRSHPFRKPHLGSAGVEEYTRKAFSVEKEVRARFGSPIVQGAAGAFEYWASLREDGEPWSIAGCDILRFAPDGGCRELRDYWHEERTTHEPPPGWGQ